MIGFLIWIELKFFSISIHRLTSIWYYFLYETYVEDVKYY